MNTDTSIKPSSIATVARTRAGLYSFIALHFNHVVNAELVDKIRDARFSEMLHAIADGRDSEDPLTIGAVLMAVFIQKTRGDDRQAVADRLGVERTRLYRGLSPNHGLTPPYEALWTGRTENPVFLHGLAQFYQRAGVELVAKCPERLDYLGVELDFMRLLAEREAAAWDANDEGSAANLYMAQKQFFDEHLSGWTLHFVEKALDSVKNDFYRAHLHMLVGLIETEKVMLS